MHSPLPLFLEGGGDENHERGCPKREILPSLALPRAASFGAGLHFPACESLLRSRLAFGFVGWLLRRAIAGLTSGVRIRLVRLTV
jgi:hypothetical protein